jgi:hypothetical protein
MAKKVKAKKRPKSPKATKRAKPVKRGIPEPAGSMKSEPHLILVSNVNNSMRGHPSGPRGTQLFVVNSW